MRALYVDNFRGFSETFIPLRTVNFLVGENSTGKSSILALLTLFSEPTFWFSQDFNAAEVGLGTFQDIVSIDANNRKYFQVGFVRVEPAPEGRRARSLAFLLRYVEEDAVPVVDHLHFMRDGQVLKVAFQKNSGTYDFQTIKDTEVGDAEAMFRRWLHPAETAPGYQHKLRRLPVPRRNLLPLVEVLLRTEGYKRRRQREDAREAELGIPMEIPVPSVAWIAPIRTKPRRTYDELTLEFSAEGTHTPYLLRKLKKSHKSRVTLDDFLAKFGLESGLFRSVDVRNFGEGADSPFAVEVTLSDRPLNMRNVGYGVSQSLPVVLELFARPRGTVFAIQQPEVHLHPRAQAALGDMMFRLAAEERKSFFVETHSDFTIDRFRMNYRKAQRKPDGQVLFFERNGKGNRVTSLPFTDKGEYPGEQPKSFRAFFLKEQLDLLGS